MAFPVVQDADTTHDVVTSNSNSWTLTYPSNIASGDLLLLFVATDGTNFGTYGLPTGWKDDAGTDAEAWFTAGPGSSAAFAYRIATGSESGTFALSLPAAEQGAWRILRITGAHASTIPEIAGASSSSGDPNPPSLNPANWDVEDTLWFAACSIDGKGGGDPAITAWPLADNQQHDVAGGANGASLGLCETGSAVASLDPSTFTVDTSQEWVAFTIAVRPAGAAAQGVTGQTLSSGVALYAPTVVVEAFPPFLNRRLRHVTARSRPVQTRRS